MKIKIYHPTTDEFGRINSPEIIIRGYVEMKTFDAEDIFNLCNWSHWSEEKPEVLHSDIDHCGHGLIIYNPNEKEYWLSLSVGWLRGNNKKIIKYVKENWRKEVWE